MSAERLLPGTDAISRGTVDLCRRGRFWLVRYRELTGGVRREEPRTVAEADRIFWAWVADLRRNLYRSAGC